MTHEDQPYRWEVILDSKQQLTEIQTGYASTLDNAVIDALLKARKVMSARGSIFMPYCTIDVSYTTQTFSEWIALSDLDLPDAEFISRFRNGLSAQQDHTPEPKQAGDRQTARALYPTVSTSAETQWRRLLEIIEEPLPEGRAPAPESSFEGVDEGKMGGPNSWKSELTTHFAYANTNQWMTPYGPFYTPQESIIQRLHLLQIMEKYELKFGEAHPNVAGSPTYQFIPEFVPIAGDDRAVMALDVRRGDLNGCVTIFTEENDSPGALWVSLSAMLADLVDTLSTGVAFQGVWVAHLGGGNVSWEAP